MIKYNKIKGKRYIFRSITGLNPEEFEKLLPAFGKAYRHYEEEHKDDRKREFGAGAKAVLNTIEDKLLFILFYYRIYPVQVVQGFFFNMNQPCANKWIYRLSGILKNALGYEMELPRRRSANLNLVLEMHPGLELFLDGTERPINRPKYNQEECYSGKKKRHTKKNVLITDEKKKVVSLSETYEGKKHDKDIADEENYHFARGSPLWLDAGFLGYEPMGVDVFMPKRKPRGKELTELEKLNNTNISKNRIFVENVICSVKINRIVSDKFRGRKDNFDDEVMEVSCGLHNFRATHRNYRV